MRRKISSTRHAAFVLAILLFCSTAPECRGLVQDPDLSGTSARTQAYVKDYFGVRSSCQSAVLKVIADGKSQSDWNSACSRGIARANRISLDDDAPEHFKKWLAGEKEAWNSVKSVGGRIAKENEFLVKQLGQTKKELVLVESEARGLSANFKKRADQATAAAGDISQDLGTVKRMLAEFGLKDLPGTADDIIAKGGIALRAVRKAVLMRARVHEYQEKVRERKESLHIKYYEECLRSLKAQRRNIERLVDQDLDGKSTSFGDLERNIESMVLSRLDDYDKMIEEYEESIEEFADDAKIWPDLVLPLAGDVADLATSIGISAPANMDEKIDRYIETLGKIKRHLDGRVKKQAELMKLEQIDELELKISELKEAYVSELHELQTRKDGRINRVQESATKEHSRMEKALGDLETSRAEITQKMIDNNIGNRADAKRLDDEIEELKEEIEFEKRVLAKQLVKLIKDFDREKSQLTRKLDEQLDDLRDEIKKVSR